ncbi:MAG: hypothetical protein D6743_06365, partial [Calditrichaeota bacterium]
MNRRLFLGSLGTGAILAAMGRASSGQAHAVPPHLRNYASLYRDDPRAAAVKWFRDAKFGLFVHYALASLLAGGKPEYLKLIAGLEDAVEAGKLPAAHAGRRKAAPASLKAVQRIHHELMRRFRAEKFDAGAICDLALAAHMRYVNFTTKHLGRLAMYRTTTTDFNSLNAPAGRDLVGEMAEACAARRLGLFLYVPPETARTDGPFFEQNQTILRELLTQYGPIAGIWFDGIGNYRKAPENYTRLAEHFALIRRLQPHCLISFKEGAIGEEDFTSPEHFHLPVAVQWDTPQRQARWEVRLERWKRFGQQAWETWFKDKPVEINTTMQQCY